MVEPTQEAVHAAGATEQAAAATPTTTAAARSSGAGGVATLTRPKLTGQNW